ncbi:MAG: DUF302 domain-containing protein [Bacteroidetes bacterium]|nr:DUF302 domain-containing protein [Bacteroidota bacterium]
MRNLVAVIMIFLWFSALSAQDLIVKTGNKNVSETVEALEKRILEKGFTIVQKVNHAKAAEKQELTLAPSIVIIFGNPKVGTKLMQENPNVAYDLPLRIAVFENKKGETTITYRNGDFLAKQYELDNAKDILEQMNKVLDEITNL